jgi:hypothetical protein
MSKLILDPQEFSWLARYSSRRIQLFETLTGQEKKKLAAITDIYKSIEKKLNSQPTSDASLNIELPFNRKELRVIQEAVINRIVIANSKHLPEYQKRKAKGQDVTEYVQAEEALVLGLTEFLNKVQGAL